METKKIHLQIKRQNSPSSYSYWESFEVEINHSTTITDALQEIQKHPVNSRGEKTSPPVWGGTCLEEICGGCAIQVNGQIRLSCSTLLDSLKSPVVLEPLSKFPLLRDLMIDLEPFMAGLNRFLPWMEIDGLTGEKESPPLSQDHWKTYYPLSLCTMCGACLEACPQVNPRSAFVGAGPLIQALVYSGHPNGKSLEDERMEEIMGRGGIVDCGHIGLCAQVCPQEIPITTSLLQLARKATWKGITRFFGPSL